MTYFFTPLAKGMRARALGIIFSGYDGDGAEGCKRIKAAGGTTFFQVESAAISSMPLHARATGGSDFVLAAHKIPAELHKLKASLVKT